MDRKIQNMNIRKNTSPSLVRSRVTYIDYAKALGMLLIIWGHTKLTGISNEFCYAFHIPLFFFLSGMVFSRDRYATFGQFVGKKAQTLLVPYVVFSVLTWMLWATYSYLSHAHVNSLWMPLLQTVIAQGSGGFLEHNVPLWFVTCLFVVEVIYWFTSKLKDGVNVLLCVVFAVVGYTMDYHCDVWNFRLMPWSIDVAMMAVIFYALGNQFAKRVTKDRLMTVVNSHQLVSWVWVIVGLAVTAYVGHMNGMVSMGHARLGNNPLVFYLIACVGTSAILTLCVLMAGWRNNSVFEKAIWFGRHSFDAMAIHNPIRQIVMVAMAIVLHTSSDAISENTVQSLLSFVMTLTITMVGMFVVDWVRKHVKLQSIFARKTKDE